MGISVDCKNDSPLKARCDFEVDYKLKCDVTCSNWFEAIPVSGTVNYSSASSLCRAAFHDGRISTWDLDKRVVSFRRTKLHSTIIRDSINRGILSSKGSNFDVYEEFFFRNLRHDVVPFSKSNDYFYFTSPRIKEALLDITSLHRGYLGGSDILNAQECHLPDKTDARTVQFTYRHPGLNEQNMPLNLTKHSTDNHDFYRVEWKRMTGAVLCHPSRNDLSTVTSMTMDREVDFAPTNGFTITVNYGDSVVLSMVDQRKGACDNHFIWRKDISILVMKPYSKNTINYDFEHKAVNLGHAGVYSLECQNRNSEMRFDARGVLRLIVRSCPANFYGDHCNMPCPICRNGGVCHDLLGACICPPGFKGSNCETACGADTYGRNCDRKCSDTNFENDKSCFGILFCLPDPYGCSCATGFKGLDCETTCDSGYFGAGCSQKCHCLSKQPCDIFTGRCPNACAEGWKGEACQVYLPVFSEKPKILNVSSRSVEISFESWNNDRERGNPLAYIYEKSGKRSSPLRWIKESF